MQRSSIGSTVLAACALGLVAAGCTSNSSSTATTTAPSPATSTETFSGTIPQLGSTGFSFTVASAGSVDVSLASVAPLATMALGVGITTWNGTTCATTIAKNDNARAGATALSGTATAGSYCVSVYDSGNIADGSQASFTVQVTHP